jgi:hypothetical protein
MSLEKINEKGKRRRTRRVFINSDFDNILGPKYG